MAARCRVVTVSVFVGTSLDGFIARPDGAIDFLDAAGDGGGDDGGFAAFMASVDVLVMGRATYDLLLTFDQWVYGDKPLVVLTHRPLPPPRWPQAKVAAMAGEPAEVMARLAKRGWTRLYVDGGQVVHQFLRAGLVDRLVVTRLPVLIGQGISLFCPLPADIRLQHKATRVYGAGFVQSEYAVLR